MEIIPRRPDGTFAPGAGRIARPRGPGGRFAPASDAGDAGVDGRTTVEPPARAPVTPWSTPEKVAYAPPGKPQKPRPTTAKTAATTKRRSTTATTTAPPRRTPVARGQEPGGPARPPGRRPGFLDGLFGLIRG